MTSAFRLTLLASLVILLAGCFDDDNNNISVGSQARFTANLTAIEVTNTDTGEQVDVGGLPAAGDEVIKD